MPSATDPPKSPTPSATEKPTAKLNPFAHKALHAGLGAASAAITGGDPVAGAIGAVASETAAEAMDKPNASRERQQIAQKARLVGDTVAFLAGRDITSADKSGKTAVENNFAREHAFAMFTARRNIVNDERLSDAEKQQRLVEVDELSKQIILAGGKGAALGLIGTGIVAAAPAINTAGLSTSAYLLTNPTGMQVASLAQKTAVSFGTGAMAFHYGQTAVQQGPAAAFHAMQQDAAMALSVPTEVVVNTVKNFVPAPQEAPVIKHLVKATQPVVSKNVAATQSVQHKIEELKTLSERWNRYPRIEPVVLFALRQIDTHGSHPWASMVKSTFGFFKCKTNFASVKPLNFAKRRLT